MADETTRPPVGNVHRTRWNARGATVAAVPWCAASPRNISCAEPADDASASSAARAIE